VGGEKETCFPAERRKKDSMRFREIQTAWAGGQREVISPSVPGLTLKVLGKKSDRPRHQSRLMGKSD